MNTQVAPRNAVNDRQPATPTPRPPDPPPAFYRNVLGLAVRVGLGVPVCLGFACRGLHRWACRVAELFAWVASRAPAGWLCGFCGTSTFGSNWGGVAWQVVAPPQSRPVCVSAMRTGGTPR